MTSVKVSHSIPLDKWRSELGGLGQGLTEPTSVFIPIYNRGDSINKDWVNDAQVSISPKATSPDLSFRLGGLC